MSQLDTRHTWEQLLSTFVIIFFRLKSATAGILDTLFYHIIIFDIKIINYDNQNRNDAIIMTRDKDFNLLTFCDCIDYVQT